MSSEEEKLAAARRRMIEQDLRARGITRPDVLAAFEQIPRERFLPYSLWREAYSDHPLPIGHGQTISQPYIVALMIQELDVRPSCRVLDVGSGSGYQTALLSLLAEEVHGLERINELAETSRRTLADLGLANAQIHVSDGTLGLPEQAPLDRIICGAAAPDVPQAWMDQLADGGRIVLPVGGRDVQTLLRIEKTAGRFRRVEICGVRFVPLIGEQGWRN
jgi:protein-L-isoaspartate(D-aspartate) O-methyltransferase